MLTVTQNAQSGTQQTRTYTYDGLGRITSEVNPESGTTNYTYDSIGTGNCAGTYNGDLIKRVDAVGNVTCYTYDALHRVKDITYPFGSYAAATAQKHYVYDTATVNGVAMANAKGQLAEAYTGTSGSKTTDLGYSYSVRGELTDVYESTPHSGGYYHTTATYFENGAVKTLAGIPGQSSFTYGVDGEGRPATAMQGSNTLVSATTFNPSSQPLTATLGLGDSDTYVYDPSTGRMTSYTFTVGATPKSMAGTLTWNPNGTLSKLVITDGFNSGGAQTCKYGDPSTSIPGFDDLVRLINVDCGASTWQQNFSFDAFGNLTKSVPTGGTGIAWNPGYNAANNRYTLAGTGYDTNGNLLTDTFHTYSWDADGHPATIDSSTCGTNGTCVTYDALGRMAEKNVTGVYSELLYSPLGKTAVMNGSTIVDVYVPLPGGDTFHMVNGGQHFWHADWLGTMRLSSSRSNRTVVHDRAFAPFGEVYKNFGATDRIDYTGDTQNLIAGTFDTVNRELNPNQGRWISPAPAGLGAVDPSNPQSWNRYVYVTNNPLALIDPLGLQPTCVLYYYVDGELQGIDFVNCPDPHAGELPDKRGGDNGGSAGGNGNSGNTSGPTNPPAANNGSNCASPNFLQKIEIKLLTKLADKLGKTVGIGLGGSAGAGLGGPRKLVGMYGTVSFQLMVSPGGAANLAYSYGGTLLTGNPLTIVYGAGGLFGLQASISNSPPSNGYSLDASGGGGYRSGGGLDASVVLDNNTFKNPSWTLTGTGGLAFGGYGGAGAIVKTVVVPICKD